MASILNADNGVVSGSAGLKSSADSSGVLELQTNGTAALSISTSQVVSTTNGVTIQGLTVGRGAGAVATNTAVGASALAANSAGSGVTAIGTEALAASTASNNTAVGYQAAYVSTASDNTAIGVKAMLTNTTGTLNVATGGSALRLNTTGSSNTAMGVSALYNNTTASDNTAVGYQAGYTVTTSSGNVFVGKQAGYLATGFNNTIVGVVAGGLSAMSGNDNVLVGQGSGYALTSGARNTFVGGGQYGVVQGSGSAVTTGTANTILGHYSGNQGGLDIRTASNYIVLSDGDGNPRGWFDSNGSLSVGTVTNTLGGGSRINAQASNAIYTYTSNQTGSGGKYHFQFADSGTACGTITSSGSTTSYNTSSDYRLKNTIAPMTGALAKVALLKPVTYKWNIDGSDGEGFIAHELAEVMSQCVTGDKDAVDAEGNPKYQGIDTSFLVATLTAAIQELKAEFDAYKATHP
jgi:hypothetical protein